MSTTRSSQLLRLGWQLDRPSREAVLETREISRHAALLAQSGAGKSFLLGRLLEEILLGTQARIVVLDTNGDARRIAETEHEAWAATSTRWDRLPLSDYSTAAEFQKVWDKVAKIHLTLDVEGRVDRSGVMGIRPALDWYSVEASWRAEALGLELGRDYRELALLREAEESLRASEGRRAGLPRLVEELQRRGRALAEVSANEDGELGHIASLLARLDPIAASGIWSEDEETADLAAIIAREEDAWDLLVLDLPCVRNDRVRTHLVAYALEALWDVAHEEWEAALANPSGAERVPTLVVIDECQNFAPVERPEDPIGARVTENILRIAAEGRKYGLFLIVATQRPSKVNRGLLSECENLCLLRLQSPIEHQIAVDTWGVSSVDVARTRYFDVGDGLLFGRWAPSPLAFHSAFRRTREGGASLDYAIWSKPRILDLQQDN